MITANQHIRRVARYKLNPRLKGDSWKYYENWLEDKAPGTQKAYLRQFIDFLAFLDTDTEGLYLLYLEMIKNEDPRRKKQMRILVSNYQKHMIEVKKKGVQTTVIMIQAIKGFFDANEIPLKTGKRIKKESNEIPTISHDQFSKVLSVTGSYKMKAYLKLARDSGLRTGDIANLPIRIVREALDNPSIEYFTFEWKQGKTGKMANPVLGPDSLDALREWHHYRVNTLNLSTEDKDALFCVEINKSETTDVRGRKIGAVVKGNYMGNTSMGGGFHFLVKKANLKPLPGETRLPSIHSLRKYHWTTLQYAGIPTTWIEKMQGRVGVGTGGIYTKPNPEQLIEMYKKGYSALSGIEKDQQEKVDSLTHELGLSQFEIAELRKERDKNRSDYELNTRLQNIIDKARLEGWPEEIIKKLEENLESVETFEDGVLKYRAARAKLLMTADMSHVHEPVLNLTE